MQWLKEFLKLSGLFEMNVLVKLGEYVGGIGLTDSRVVVVFGCDRGD